MHKVLRRLPATALATTLVTVLAACGGSSSTNSAGGGTSADTGQVQSAITYGMNNPNYATQLPIFIAKAKGYFDEVGIKNVKVITTDNFVAGLVGGSLDIAQGDTDQWLTAAQKSNKVVFLGTYRYKEWHILGVSKGINTASDLIGKKVTAGQRGGRNEFVLKTMLTDLSLDPGKVEFVPLGGGSDARLQALINGQVQGAVIFPRHLKPLEAAGGQALFKDLANVPQEGIATRPDFLKDNRATVVAFWKATLKARQYMQDPANEQEILKIMRDAGFDIPAAFEELYSTEIQQISPDGGLDAAKMTDLVKNEQDLDIIPKGLDWKKYVDFTPLWDAQKAVGITQNPQPSSVQ